MTAHRDRCYCADGCPMPRQHGKGCGRIPPCDCICEPLEAEFRDGYNAHAYTLQHWRDTHGPYRTPVDNPVDKQ